MQKKQPNRAFRSHVIFWFLLVAGLVLSITGYSIYRSAEGYLVEKFLNQQKQGVKAIAAFIDGDFHKTITRSNIKTIEKNEKYKRYRDALDNYIAIDKEYRFIYTVNANLIKQELTYGLLPFSSAVNIDLQEAESPLISGQTLQYDAFFFDQVFSLINKAEKKASIQSTSSIANQKNSDFMSFALILDRNKQPAGVVVVEVLNSQIEKMKNDLLQSMLVVIGLLFICLLLASILFAHKITRPFEKLTDAIERLIKNEMNFQLSLNDFGGFSYTAKQFNLMLLKLQVSKNEIISTNKAYSRFVPHNVLKLI
ncbi:MAG: sensor histidine kinase, partial [Kangiellaceae bacterium]